MFPMALVDVWYDDSALSPSHALVSLFVSSLNLSRHVFRLPTRLSSCVHMGFCREMIFFGLPTVKT